jgi:membrane protein involved in colicin uptake
VQAQRLDGETNARKIAEAELATAREEATEKAAAAVAAAQETAAKNAELRAILEQTATELDDTRARLDSARAEAEKKLREHWETSRYSSLPARKTASNHSAWPCVATLVRTLKSCCTCTNAGRKLAS